MIVRPAAAGDEDAVLAVVFDAFSSPGRDGSEEVAIVRGTWGAGAPSEPALQPNSTGLSICRR